MGVFDEKVTALDGRPTTLAEYAGRVLLIVNTASKCGFTPQFEGLEALHRRFGPDRFAVLGFPATSSPARSRATPPRSPRSAPRPTT